MTRRGDRLRAFAMLLFDARTMERVVDPAIADLQIEPFSVARYLAVLKVIALCLPEVTMKLGAAFALSTLAVGTVVAALELPQLMYAFDQHALDKWMPVYLIPQALSIGLSVGLTIGILSAFGGQAVSRRAMITAAGLALATSVVSFVNAGWVTPIANQAFRAALAERTAPSAPVPERGFNELTFGEVRQQFAIASRDPGAIDPTDLHYVAVSYHGRWAVTVAPVVFSIFALVLARRRSIARWGAGLGACVAYLSYLLNLSVPRLAGFDGGWLGGAAWYPLVVLTIVIAIMLAHSLWARGRTAHVTA